MTSCPSDRQLSDYLCGQLSSAELRALDDHLPACSDCAARLRSAEQENECLVEALRDTTCDDSTALGQHVAEATALKAALALQLSTSAEPLSSVGAYELLESIGSGGMGNVYLARHKSLNKRVAIKLLPLRWTPHRDDLMRRFEREIRAAGALEHPAIVAAHDAGTDAQVYYLAMDFVDGVDLAQVARSIDRLEIADAAAIGLQVAQGLAYAHGKGMVHRDVKPSNIMLDKSGQVRILDFGLVLMDPWEESAGELTTVGQFLGTLDYMATRQYGSFFATEYFMQPGGFQANVSDSEGFMGKLKQHYWSLDTGAALAALLEELLTKHPRSTQACVALLSNVEPSRLEEHPSLVKQIRDELIQVDFPEVARAMEGADQSPIDMFVVQSRGAHSSSQQLRRNADEGLPSTHRPLGRSSGAVSQ